MRSLLHNIETRLHPQTAISFARLRSRVLLVCSVGFCMLMLTGCHFSKVSCKRGLRLLSGSGDFNTYNQPAFVHEQRHHLKPHNRTIEYYRLLHGPVSMSPSPHMVQSYQELNWQETETMLPYNPEGASDVPSEFKTVPDPETLPKLNAPGSTRQLAPPAKKDAPESVKPPVEILLPFPLDPQNKNLDSNGNESSINDRQHPAPPAINGPTARYNHSSRKNIPLRNVGYQQQKSSLPSASILFARP